MSLVEEALALHEKNRGKIEIKSKVKVKNARDLSLAYTPGVAEPCKRIHDDPDSVYRYTSKGNMVAVVSDGTAVLGLGDIGPRAALPVMEGKAILFKEFAGIDAVPICLDTTDVNEIVQAVRYIAPSFGGINLEDIKAPKCFEIESRLKAILDIPVFHDDQHGTAIVVLAALKNALKLVDKTIAEVKIVINGAGAAGIAIAKLLLKAGAKNIVMCDKKGILSSDDDTLEGVHREMAVLTNPFRIRGNLADAIRGADVFIGVSAGGVLKGEMVKSMADRPIVFAMANPIPEIMPDEAYSAGAYIVGTGRSDFPNQINNVLAFPGVFKGALKVRAKDINEDMKLAAADAISSLISDNELRPDYIIPSVFDERVVAAVAEAVSASAIKTGAARIRW
ncbi:malate dehydrogenase (oxaloacetate-decarboxylating) [Caldanaerobius fijiensis DSM 17918]|uniref:Malate dehydrogenase (Oxaloacetate-decarboxylating) n=1 Tax=Caldanaerobius fijiensis DSM 17918 TaxID=1121256 RepID=A0A1M4X4K3_9THEO|nr:malic enzyme-like NAD(P)-binding protein [Caldanaerobius fijiensis]SHE88283.1 malate dehydrogenase (oxaloacetate-decarboxylating) [Caldanaerobius fijiensis DSM 17918]